MAEISLNQREVVAMTARLNFILYTFKSVEEWVDSKTLSVNILIKSCMQ
jgi:hypothetical protein